MAIAFDGVKRLRSVGGGLIKILWDPAISNIGIESYNIYIRKEDEEVAEENNHS